MPVSEAAFRPAWWLPGPHLQTLWAALVRRRQCRAVQHERLELADGDFLDLGWLGPPVPETVLIMHGLEGSARSPYAAGMAAAAARNGWRTVLMHFRGCSGRPNRLARSYHSGETGDLAAVIAHCHRRIPGLRLAAIGFSLGGNVLLKYLGERGEAAGLEAATAVSVPFRLADAADRLDSGFSRLYQWRLLRSLRAKLRSKADLLRERIDCGRAAGAANFREFDDCVTAPLHGFAGADDYYLRSSCRQYLPGIRTPTLILQSRDDPFMTPAVIPTAEELAESVQCEISASGGHVGFVSGPVPWRARYWLEERSIQFFREHLGSPPRETAAP